MLAPGGRWVLRNWMPLLVALIRYSSLSSKSAGSPPRQMTKVFSLSGFASVVWPIRRRSRRASTRIAVPALQLMPSKICSKPV